MALPKGSFDQESWGLYRGSYIHLLSVIRTSERFNSMTHSLYVTNIIVMFIVSCSFFYLICAKNIVTHNFLMNFCGLLSHKASYMQFGNCISYHRGQMSHSSAWGYVKSHSCFVVIFKVCCPFLTKCCIPALSSPYTTQKKQCEISKGSFKFKKK